MNRLPAKLPRDYASLLSQVKDRIRQAQTRAVLSANAEMIWLYWDVGQMLLRRQAQKGWGAGVLDRLARDIHNDLAEVKGFSRRNLFLMTQFCREYPNLSEIVQPAVAQLASSPTLSVFPPTANNPVSDSSSSCSAMEQAAS
jgi:hypothetical protein